MNELSTINIRPGVNVLAVLAHLNYKSWFALAEFVDNSIQSALNERKQLRQVDGEDYCLCVDLKFEAQKKQIVITDNAAGISGRSYVRAFRPAEVPSNSNGLSEFGMGMKSAACWFSPRWSVRTSAIGENVERIVMFDIDKIVQDNVDELHVVSTSVAKKLHYTEIRLEGVRRFPQGKTLLKIKNHLTSIYRVFMREGMLILTIDGEPLVFEEPEVLVASSYKDPNGPKILWKKEICIDLGEGKRASGFVGIRNKISNQLAGLALFRRKRLVMGSFDETYRPKEIFGSSNSYAYLRLFGEIHLSGFQVSHTKDGFKWGDTEELFLRLLRGELENSELPLLQQVREYRSKKDAKAAREDAAKALISIGKRLDDQPLQESSVQNQAKLLNEALPDLSIDENENVDFRVHFQNQVWIVTIQLSYATESTVWLDICSKPGFTDPEPRRIVIRMSMNHPFIMQFQPMSSEHFMPILNIAAAMALAEVAAAEGANRNPSSVRQFANEILLHHFGKRFVND